MNMHNRLDLGGHLTRLGLTGEGVEVGVLFGEYAEAILSSWPGTLHLVDPWEQQSPKVYRDGCNAVDMDEAMEEAMARTARFGDRVRMHRTYSLVAAAAFEDEQLDFVYIDANHSDATVSADLAAWWPKLKAGGTLGGHDFYDKQNHFINCGVKTAVQRFAREKGLKLVLTPDCTSWWLTKEDPKPMVTVVGISHVDLPHAHEWLRWVHHLTTLNEQADAQRPLVLSFTQRVPAAQRKAFRALLQDHPGQYNVDLHVLQDVHERGYPGSASHLFVRSLQYCSKTYPGSPILWVECDTVPMQPGWTKAIEDEYMVCGAPFMGHLELGCRPPHMAGVAVYPPNWQEMAPLLPGVLNAPDSRSFGPGKGQAFDTYAAPDVLPQAVQARTIHQIWKPDRFDEELLARIPDGTALFHQCKDSRLIHTLALERFPTYISEDSPIEQDQ